jgi:hypothetical protein
MAIVVTVLKTYIILISLFSILFSIIQREMAWQSDKEYALVNGNKPIATKEHVIRHLSSIHEALLGGLLASLLF